MVGHRPDFDRRAARGAQKDIADSVVGKLAIEGERPILVEAGDGIVLHARCQVVIAAKAAGITPIDNVFLDIPNIAGLAAETRQGKQLGYEGKACIHPNQVEPVNAVYTPTPEEVEYARELIAAFKQAVGEGKGAVAFRGRMIDGPIADIERIVLERAKKVGMM